MKPIFIPAIVLIAMVATGCGESKPAEPAQRPVPNIAQQKQAMINELYKQEAALNAPRQSSPSVPAPQQQSNAASPPQLSTVAPQPPAAMENPAPPKDAQWTIACTVISGPGHVAKAKQLKDDLIRATPLKTWYVTHTEQDSTLYYGYYAGYSENKEDAKETARVHADRQRIAALQDQIGNHPFKDARPVPIAGPDPTAPPEFNLLNAQGYWSLQVAAYQGQGRKEMTIDAVREARKSGVEAYYHHGPSVSEVCIGAWPENAVRRQQFDGGVNDPLDHERPIMLLGPGAVLPPSMKDGKGMVDPQSGKEMQVLEQRVEVVDLTLRAAMEKYPQHALNGEDEFTQGKDKATGRTISIPKPTVLVPIPQRNSVLQSEPTYAPALLNPVAAPPTGGGRLKSIGQ